MFAIKKTKEKFKKLPSFIAKNAFYLFLFFSAIFALIIYTKIFRQFSMIEKREIEIQAPKIQINEASYSQFIQNYSKRKESISVPANYSNIFFGQ